MEARTTHLPKKLRPLDALEKKEGVQGGPSISPEKEGIGRCSESVWKLKIWTNRRSCRKICERSTDFSVCFQSDAGEYQGVIAAPVARGGEKEA